MEVLRRGTQRVVHVDVVARTPQPLHHVLDVAAPVEHGPARLDRALVRRHQVLGRVHRHATGPQAVHLCDHEVHPGRQRPEMLESARRPRKVEAVQVRRKRVHVDGAVGHPLLELLRRTQPERVQVHQSAGPLHLGVRPARSDGGLVRLVGGDDVTAGVGEERHQRLLPHAEPEPRAPGGEHAPLPQRLGDEEPLPHLAVEHHLAAVVPHRPQPLGPGPQSRCTQGLGRAQLRAQHDRATLSGCPPRAAAGPLPEARAGRPPAGRPPPARSAQSSVPAPSP